MHCCLFIQAMYNKLAIFFLLAGLTSCQLVTYHSGYSRFSVEFFGAFDTVTVITGYAENEERFSSAAQIILERLEELHKLYDIYNSYDNINNLHTVNESAGIKPVAVHEDIINMLLLAKEGYELTGGAFNISLGPVLSIWHDYREKGLRNPDSAVLPPMPLLLAATAFADINDVIIDEEAGTVFLQKQGMSLDVGSIAKGYAARILARTALEAGLNSVIINLGGNITAIGSPVEQGRDWWNIGIQDPDIGSDGYQNIIDTVGLADMSISISGNYQRFYVAGGRVYNHIISPGTLTSAEIYKQVVVLHVDPAMADILSTALFILDVEEGAEMAARHEAEAFWVFLDGSYSATAGYRLRSSNFGD